MGGDPQARDKVIWSRNQRDLSILSGHAQALVYRLVAAEVHLNAWSVSDAAVACMTAPYDGKREQTTSGERQAVN